ncbi:small integral membrane protein 14-like [Homarus americanus]|uniref:Small integral membrane protein 14 n=1 Tax=Homarus americanus TaxID=6706 RepID=A0A8J5KK41_HOMAM|nr:small integral membrane protein 14-like [Homarus americanus]XP_042220671.1 small integral membrane protein 14-like [Homarus americanus]KAG7169614.1 Small integral membrane protein 14-like [Homarus americanus]
MADGGFDPCECIWSHEMAMRRLLSLLRQSQSYCTDTECYNEFPRPTPTQDVSSDGMMFMAMMWALLAVALFFMRPSSLRSNPDAKPANSNQDGGSPPAPPTAN